MPTDEDTALSAHPYRPAARFGLALLGLAVVTVATWFAWAAVARHRLAAEVDAVRRRGEPTRPEDFPDPPVADADNAAVAWRAAAAAVSTAVDSPANSNLTYRAFPPYPPAWWTAARASAAANAAVFPLADAAAPLDRARWPGGMISILGPLRELANVLSDSALLAHFGDHDDGRCLARLHDLRRLADAVDQQPNEVTRLSAIGIRAVAANQALLVAPDLDVGPPAGDRRRRVAAAVAELLDEPAATAPVGPLLANRVAAVRDMAGLRAGFPVLGPLVDLSTARELHRQVIDVRAARAPDAAAAAAVYAASPADWASISRGGPGPLRPSRSFEYGNVSAEQYTYVHWPGRADTRAAAVGVAVRMYRADHAGRWPADLPALVPAYLPAVPADPLAAGSPPVGYVVRRGALPDGGDRPLLFVGDRTGFDPATAPLPPEPTYEVVGHAHKVNWMDLARWSP